MVSYTRFPSGTQIPRHRAQAVTAPAASAPRAARPNDSNIASATRGRTGAASAEQSRSLLPLTIFLASLLIPLQFYIGSLYLNPHRVVLLVLFIPLLITWIARKEGRFYTQDFLFLAYVLWMGVTFFYNHGIRRTELVGMTIIESFGAYLVGRILVRSPREYRRVLTVLAIALLLFAPAAVLESTTGIRIYSRLADAIADTYAWVHANPYYQKRMGMYRAHLVFEHPILFGVFASTAFGLLYHRLRPDGKTVYGYRLAWLSMVNTFFSLSTGALLSLVTQIGITMWDKIMRGLRNHWKVLIGLTIAGYVVVDLLSNRTPIEVFISYATFNVGNGYVRIIIFEWGMKNVWANPIFGLGLKDWLRPGWLPPSVDNFWLLMAMRHGIPGFLFIAGTFLTVIIGLGRLKIHNLEVAMMRKGIVVAFIGLTLSLMTVHIWGPSYTFVCFLLGASVWIRDWAGANPDPEPTDQQPSAEPERVRGRPAAKRASR